MNRRTFLALSTIAGIAAGVKMLPARDHLAGDPPPPIVITLGRYPVSPKVPFWQHGKEAAFVTVDSPWAIAKAKLKWRAMLKGWA
jgi:hypothetical protein